MEFEDARKLSLEKWIDIEQDLTRLENKLESNCGFCLRARELTGSEGGCRGCPSHIDTFCTDIIKEQGKHLYGLRSSIRKTLEFVREVKENVD